MKKLFILALGFLILALPLGSQATTFNFFGQALEQDEDGIERVVGTGSATMDFSIDVPTKTLTVEVDNTSATTFVYTDDTAIFNTGSGPVTLTQGTPYNQASGIVGFGFNLKNSDTIGFSSDPTLSAFEDDPSPPPSFSPVPNLFNPIYTTEPWEIGTFLAGITLDYLPQTEGNVKGALYNPAAEGSSALAALPNYFTTATLTIEFDKVPILDFSDEWSPFVRMQNVGAEGIGSLKLTPNPNPIPEPATMLLLGSGLVGFAVVGRRKFFKKK